MKVAAVVVLYYPGEEMLSNINSYYDRVDKIYAFDNTEQGSEIQTALLTRPKISYHHDGQNAGIATRLNSAARLALMDGFDWLLMMDQDSGFSVATGPDYFECFKQYEPKTLVAMFGVNFEQDQQRGSSKCNAVFTDELITSGTLLNLLLFPEIGLFDENLFIDGVDHEYTIKTLLAGYKIVQFSNIRLTHQIGTLVKRASIKTLFLVKKAKKLHTPLRCYYVYRNNLYLQQKYKNNSVLDLSKLDKIARSIINNAFFYGKNPLQVIQYILLAKRDFKNGRMGKFIAR